jgi:hypothetical protein
MSTGVVESAEGEIETAKSPTDALEKTPRAFAAVDQRGPVEVADQPGPTGPTFQFEGQELLSIASRENLRYEFSHRSICEVGEGLDLTLDHLLVVARWSHLEHEAVPASGDQDKIPVDLARQGLGS